MTPKLRDDLPVYLKLRATLADAILAGTYRPGTQLPSVRAYASKTATNPLTVAKAYQTLQNEGLVEVRRGVGMFVAPGASLLLRAREREHFIATVWPGIMRKMEQLGLTLQDLEAKDHLPSL